LPQPDYCLLFAKLDSEAEPPEVPPQLGIEPRTERSWPSGSGQAEFAKSPTYWTKEALA